MTETLQRLQADCVKSPKRVHFEELRPTGTHHKSMTTKLRIKAGSQLTSNQHSANQFANKPLFPHNTSRDSSLISNQPKKSAMKTISPAIFSSPQQQQKSNGVDVKKSKKSGSKVEEEVVKSKNITPSIFSAPQQSETDEEQEYIVETKPQTKNAKSKKQVKEAPSPVEDQQKTMITPSIFSSPSPQKHVEESSDESEEEVQPKGKNLSKKNSFNAISPSTKHKSPVREEPIVEKEKDGITHELIKKVAGLKPLLDNVTSNTSLKSDEKNRKSNDKTSASKKVNNDREVRDEKTKVAKTGSNKSTSSAKKTAAYELADNVDSAAAQIVLGPMRSSDPIHNALNFSSIQQQQKDTPVTTTAPTIKKSSAKKY